MVSGSKQGLHFEHCIIVYSCLFSWPDTACWNYCDPSSSSLIFHTEISSCHKPVVSGARLWLCLFWYLLTILRNWTLEEFFLNNLFKIHLLNINNCSETHLWSIIKFFKRLISEELIEIYKRWMWEDLLCK